MNRLMMTGSYNNFFKIFDRSNRRDVTFEASKDIIRPRVPLKPKKVRRMYSCSLDQVTFSIFERRLLPEEGRKRRMK